MKIEVDRNIYSDKVISKVAYWLSSQYAIKRRLVNEIEEFEITGPIEDTWKFEKDFFRMLNDYKLREIITNETREIKTILYAKAFAEDDNFSETDILE